MNILAKWANPIPLKRSKDQSLIYELNLESISDEAGCYVLFNQHGESPLKVLYIGQAKNLRSRLKGQLNNLKLMKGLSNSTNGKKYIMYCTVILKPGQQIIKVLSILEENLIKAALAEGHALLNKNLTTIKYNEINFETNLTSKKIFKNKMLSPTK